jgi:hypothetical protein
MDITALDQELNEMVLTGRALEGFEKFYAENVVMMENDTAFEGKELNRKREEEFFSSVAEWHSGECLASAVNGDVTFSEWVVDVTFKAGFRVKMEQVAVRRWADGQIVQERFYYKGK